MGKKGKNKGRRPEEGASQAPTIPGMFYIFFAFPLPYTVLNLYPSYARLNLKSWDRMYMRNFRTCEMKKFTKINRRKSRRTTRLKIRETYSCEQSQSVVIFCRKKATLNPLLFIHDEGLG
jgi:hypothetical protein